eukprot:3912869-Pyramimonas_sp.AAC.1
MPHASVSAGSTLGEPHVGYPVGYTYCRKGAKMGRMLRRREQLERTHNASVTPNAKWEGREF